MLKTIFTCTTVNFFQRFYGKGWWLDLRNCRLTLNFLCCRSCRRHRRFMFAVVVVRCDRVFCLRFGVFIASWSVGFEERVDRWVARFIHVKSVVILQPNDERRSDAFHIYLRSTDRKLEVEGISMILAIHFWRTCWYPCRYSCSIAGTTRSLRLYGLSSIFGIHFSGLSLYSGRNTMKLSGWLESDSSRSMCCSDASISSSQYGGLAWNEPRVGKKSRKGLEIFISIRVATTTNQSNLPSWTEIRVGIAKSRTKLAEVAVERTREALEGDPEVHVEAVEHWCRDRCLRLLGLLLHRWVIAQERWVALQHAVDARDEQWEVVIAVVAVKLLLKQRIDRKFHGYLWKKLTSFCKCVIFSVCVSAGCAVVYVYFTLMWSLSNW